METEDIIMALSVIILVIGVMIFGAGVYYFAKEKADAESRKIYGITSAVGAVIVVVGVVRLAMRLL